LIPAVQLALQGITTPNLGDVHLHRRDGTDFPAEVSTVPIHHNNSTLGVFVIIRDRSESEQIRARTHQLEQRALLGEVTAVFAHEVRNPINNISTGLQLMADDIEKDDTNQELIKRMLHDCGRLTNLMESVLTFSRSGNYAVVPLMIVELLERLMKLWTPRMNRLNIEPLLQISDNQLQVRGDKRALEQVFTNLISNAIQAMQELGGGTLAVKISLDANGNGRSMVQVDVTDTGPGIPEENRPRIFEPFFTTKKNGTGLGLAITKQIVTAHKGSINLTTFPGGTVFHVNLPAITETEGLL
jgi:signal transduction histidine kinase